MRAPNLLSLFVTALFVSAVTEATLLDTIEDTFPGIMDILPRGGSNARAVARSDASNATITPPPTSSPTTSPPNTSPTAPASRNSGAQTSPPTTGAQPTTMGGATNQNAQNSPSPTSPPDASPSIYTSYTTVFLTTNSDGVVSSFTTVGKAVDTAPLASPTGGGSGGSSGLSTQQRNTVIGVVVGIGGAAILAGIIGFALRLWNKNRRLRQEEAEDLIGDVRKPETGGVGGAAGPASTQTFFQTNLEKYHQPAAANASANF